MQFLKSQYDTSNNKPNIIFQMFSKLFFQFWSPINLLQRDTILYIIKFKMCFYLLRNLQVLYTNLRVLIGLI